MLVLSRKRKERIIIDGRIVVTILSIGGERVRVGIDAPVDVAIEREEITVGVEQAEAVESIVPCCSRGGAPLPPVWKETAQTEPINGAGGNH